MVDFAASPPPFSLVRDNPYSVDAPLIEGHFSESSPPNTETTRLDPHRVFAAKNEGDVADKDTATPASDSTLNDVLHTPLMEGFMSGIYTAMGAIGGAVGGAAAGVLPCIPVGVIGGPLAEVTYGVCLMSAAAVGAVGGTAVGIRYSFKAQDHP